MTLSAYIKNLIIDDVKGMDLPTFKMSVKRERVALKALSDHKKGKTTKIGDIGEYLNNL